MTILDAILEASEKAAKQAGQTMLAIDARDATALCAAVKAGEAWLKAEDAWIKASHEGDDPSDCPDENDRYIEAKNAFRQALARLDSTEGK